MASELKKLWITPQHGKRIVEDIMEYFEMSRDTRGGVKTAVESAVKSLYVYFYDESGDPLDSKGDVDCTEDNLASILDTFQSDARINACFLVPKGKDGTGKGLRITTLTILKRLSAAHAGT